MFFEVLVSVLGKHGVTIHDANVKETGKVKIEIDFSEHDKVFEDKIASLEENVGYYKDSISRVEKNCDKLYHENKELKQITKGYEDKIAKLEKTVECYKQALIYKCSNFDSQSKILEKFATENESLKQLIAELESKNNQLTESILRKETKIHELESKETEKPTKYITVIVAKEINGQEYVRLEDFVSVVNDLQAKIGT